jgi:hypothetical protein
MANNISTVSIPACVVQQKNSVFVENGVIVPQIRNIPCREVFVDDIGYWATPVNDDGIFTSLKFEPQKDEYGNAIPAPSYLSFNTFRVRDKISSDRWYIVGTIEDFYASCQTCCGDAFVPMPCTVPIVPVCQAICDSTNEAGDYISIFGVPPLLDDNCYNAAGSFNGTPFPELNEASLTALVSAMNSQWNHGGVVSPPTVLSYTQTGAGTEVIVTGGAVGDVVCLVIKSLECSP